MFFQNIPLFAGLNEACHGLLLQVAVRKTYPRHALIVQEGDPGEHFYLLRRGRAKVYLSNEQGREVILALLGPGEIFGEMSLIDDEPSSANLMALEDSEFVSVGKKEFQKVLATSPDMAVGLLKVLSRRLREADHQIESLALRDVKERVVQVLRCLAVPENGELVIPSRLTHKEIAGLVAASREVVTRVLRVLEDSGVVQVQGHRITIARPAAVLAQS